MKAMVRWTGIAALLITIIITVSPALQAAEPSAADSDEISKLLSQVKADAVQLKDDAYEMESFTRSGVSWESHAMKIATIKEHVNALGKRLLDLQEKRSAGSQWQQQAIDRILPVLKDLAANVEATINHLNREQGRRLNTSEHKEYLETNAALAAEMSALVADFVSYGQTKAKFERLSEKLELAER
jgi:hypothetical protein